VRVDTLSTTNKYFWMYYGEPDAAYTGGRAAWIDYDAVYHYSEQPLYGILLDSSPNQSNGRTQTAANASFTSGQLYTGQVGTGWIYGGGQTVQNVTLEMAETSWTLSAWVQLLSDGTDFIVQGKPGYWHWAPSASSANEMQYKNDVSNQSGGVDIRADHTVTLNVWHYMTLAMDASDSTIAFTIDGVAKAYNSSYPSDGDTFPTSGLKPVPHGISTASEPLGIGSTQYPQPNCEDCMEGVVDELRIRPSLTSAGWKLTEYRNQNTPLTFISWGSQTQINTANCN